MAHHWTQQIIFYKAISDSLTENFLIIFHSITFKILFLRGRAATLSPTQLQLCGRKTAGEFCTTASLPQSTENHLSGYCLLEKIPANTLAPAQHFSHPHRSPRNDTWILQYTKGSSIWRNLLLIWSGMLLRSCFDAPNLQSREQEGQKSASESWPWHPGLCGSIIISYHHYIIISLELFSVTKIFVGFEEWKNQTEEENQQNLEFKTPFPSAKNKLSKIMPQ